MYVAMAEGVCVKKNSFFVMQVTMNVETTEKTEGGRGLRNIRVRQVFVISSS